MRAQGLHAFFVYVSMCVCVNLLLFFMKSSMIVFVCVWCGACGGLLLHPGFSSLRITRMGEKSFITHTKKKLSLSAQAGSHRASNILSLIKNENKLMAEFSLFLSVLPFPLPPLRFRSKD
jgi:hypothetical protein